MASSTNRVLGMVAIAAIPFSLSLFANLSSDRHQNLDYREHGSRQHPVLLMERPPELVLFEAIVFVESAAGLQG